MLRGRARAGITNLLTIEGGNSAEGLFGHPRYWGPGEYRLQKGGLKELGQEIPSARNRGAVERRAAHGMHVGHETRAPLNTNLVPRLIFWATVSSQPLIPHPLELTILRLLLLFIFSGYQQIWKGGPYMIRWVLSAPGAPGRVRTLLILRTARVSSQRRNSGPRRGERVLQNHTAEKCQTWA